MPDITPRVARARVPACPNSVPEQRAAGRLSCAQHTSNHESSSEEEHQQ